MARTLKSGNPRRRHRQGSDARRPARPRRRGHGSAPDVYGQNIANPAAMIWSGALMLDFLGERAAHDAIVRAIETVLAEGPRTRDLGGKASTTEIGKAIAALV